MRSLIFSAVVFLALPAFGLGDASEALCDNPPGGVTCECSEPLTSNEGTHTNQHWNPTATPSGTSCTAPGSSALTVSYTSGGAAEVAISVTESGLTNSMGVGGSGFVLSFTPTSVWKVRDHDRTFTDGTWCSRNYMYFHEDHACAPGCEGGPKGPRMDSSGDVDNCIGFQASILPPSQNWKPPFYSSTCTRSECGTKANNGFEPDAGCKNKLHPIEGNPDGINFENTDGGWLTWEVCVDHNLSETQVETTINDHPAYSHLNGLLEWPGVDHHYIRSRITVITNSNSALVGAVKTYGPAWGSEVYPDISSGRRIWIGTSAYGSPTTGWTRSTQYTAYNMIMTKSPADPLFWIGQASEVTGAASPTPTASPTTSPTATATATFTPTATPAPAGTPSGVLARVDQ